MADVRPGAGSGPGAPADLLDSTDAGPAALRGGALRSGGYAAGLLLSLASAPLLVRHLGQEDFGRYITVLSVVVIVAGFTEAGLNTIALREYATLRGPARERALADALGLRITLSAVAILLAAGFSAVAGYGSVLVLGTVLAGAGTLLLSVQTLLTVALQGKLRFGLLTLIDLARQALTVALLVTLVLTDAQLTAFFAVPIASGIVALAITAVVVRGLTPLRPRFAVAAWWSLVRDTIPFAIAIALNAAYLRVAIIVMSLLAADALQTGYFSTSFRVIEVLIGVPALVIGAAFPILTRAVRDDPARFAQATERVFELAVLAGALTALCVGLGAGFAVDVIGGDAAAPAADVLRIQSVAMLATFVSVACSYPLLSLRRNRDLMVANAIALGLIIVLCLVLVPPLQAQGAAIAAVTAESVLAATLALMLVRAAPQLRLPLSVLPVSLAGAVAAVGAARLIGGGDVLAVAVGAPVFVAVVGLLGRFPPEVSHALRTRRQPAADR